MLDMDTESVKATAAVVKATLIGGISAALGHLVDIVHNGLRFSWLISIMVVVCGAWLGWLMDGLLPRDLDERGVYIGIVCVSARPVVIGIKDLGPDVARAIVDRIKRMIGGE